MKTRDNFNKQPKEISCKLTSPELQQRKAIIIANLKKKIINKKELEKGYAYEFNGSDNMLDDLITFIKSERKCCEFFDFDLTIKGGASSLLLTITGPEGVKEFISGEIEM